MWWWGEDSNLRRLRRQIYSLFPLAAREPHQFYIPFGADTPIRTEDILITSETLYQLSYIGLTKQAFFCPAKKTPSYSKAFFIFQV